MFTLKNKTALVTGSAKRIGASVSRRLAKEGVNIIVHYRNSKEEACELVKELESYNVKAKALYGDFSDLDGAAVDSFFTEAKSLTGSVDILINSASIFPETKLQDMTAKDITDNVTVNSILPFALSKAFYNALDSEAGVIINFLDTKIKSYDFKHSAYILSKHMLANLTAMTAIDFAPKVRVNAVAPGLVLGPAGTGDDYLGKLKDTVPLKSFGSAEDINEAVVFLIKSDFITGQVVYVDGGAHIN